MGKAWKHFCTITYHRYLVAKGCFHIGLFRQGFLHDLSKYSPAEFLVGAKHFQGTRSPNDAEREEAEKLKKAAKKMSRTALKSLYNDFLCNTSRAIRPETKLKAIELILRFSYGFNGILKIDNEMQDNELVITLKQAEPHYFEKNKEDNL